jgi:ATP-binding cassette, subfamily F, member 3
MIIKNISKYIHTKLLFESVSFSIEKGCKIALIGENGSGKTTLFKIIKDESRPDTGKIKKPKAFSLGSLNQERFHSKQSVFDFIYDKNHKKLFWDKEVKRLKDDLSNKYSEKKMEELIEAEIELAKNSDDKYEARLLKILDTLNLKEETWFNPMDSLSGGEFLKVNFARLIVQSHDLILLDEPTNHLDIPTKKWLIDFIKNLKEAVFVVSHDRTLLKTFPQKILELEHQRIWEYTGNFDDYKYQKQNLVKQQTKTSNNFLREKEKYEQQIKRYWEFQMKAGGDNEVAAKKRKATEKNLEKLLKEEPIDPSKKTEINFNKKDTERIGNYLVRIKDFCLSIEDRELIKNFNLELYKDDKVFLLAPNGSGKTTFLKILTLEYIRGMESRGVDHYQEDKKTALMNSLKGINFSGEIKFSQTADLGFFEQSDELNQSITLQEFIADTCRHETKEKRFFILKNYGFNKDDLDKALYQLSGGQKSKLKLMQIMYTRANFLILDEPTNHLDLISIEELEKFVKDFKGTVLGVTHDEEFGGNFEQVFLSTR